MNNNNQQGIKADDMFTPLTHRTEEYARSSASEERVPARNRLLRLLSTLPVSALLLIVLLTAAPLHASQDNTLSPKVKRQCFMTRDNAQFLRTQSERLYQLHKRDRDGLLSTEQALQKQRRALNQTKRTINLDSQRDLRRFYEKSRQFKKEQREYDKSAELFYKSSEKRLLQYRRMIGNYQKKIKAFNTYCAGRFYEGNNEEWSRFSRMPMDRTDRSKNW
ncbi:MAG: hypothetical protein HQL50_02970 [Magnetococcales bacterium]|nr:hypothetical protein [Magnetococcales bacterium]